MSNLSKYQWTIIHRHQNGKHSKDCPVYSANFLGLVCKYSRDPLSSDIGRVFMKGAKHGQ